MQETAGYLLVVSLYVTHCCLVVEAAHPETLTGDIVSVLCVGMWSTLVAFKICYRHSCGSPWYRALAVGVFASNVGLLLLFGALSIRRYKALVLTLSTMVLAVGVFFV